MIPSLDKFRLLQLFLLACLQALVFVVMLAVIAPTTPSRTFVLILFVTNLVVAHLEWRSMPSSTVLGGMLLVGVALSVVVLPNFIRCVCRGPLTACKSNLKNLGTGLEMYATDWAGQYPPEIAYITPNYLKTIPTCPSAGKDTYSRSYRVHHEPEHYTVVCRGCYHHGASIDTPNYPQYTAVQGLIERP